jgi:hypothetical protein
MGRIFLGLFMLDVLFMPYLLPIPVPISGLLIPFWLLSTGIRVSGKVWMPCLLGSFTVALSYFVGLYTIVHDQELYLTRFVNAGILVYMFVTFALAQEDAKGNSRIIVMMLQAYVALSFLLALVFFLEPNVYFSIREQWTFNTEEVYYSALTVLVRYTGILSDPNNMAASTSAVAAMLVFLEPRRILRNVGVIAMTAVILVATMSVTGLVCFLVLTGSYIFLSRFTERFSHNMVMRIVAVAVLAIAAFGVYLFIKDQLVLQLALERVSQSDPESRFSRWLIVFDYDKIVDSVLIGDGGSIFWEGRDYRPHNGHLYLIFAFGIFAYVAFVWVFFRCRRNLGITNFVFSVIMFICFTVNVGIYEHRFSGIWVILAALYAEASRRRANLSNEERRSTRARRSYAVGPSRAGGRGRAALLN